MSSDSNSTHKSIRGEIAADQAGPYGTDLRAAANGPERRRSRLAALGNWVLLRGEQGEPLTDPGDIFWDDLVAANRLKIYLLSNGVDVPREVEESLAVLTARYGPSSGRSATAVATEAESRPPSPASDVSMP